MWRFPLILVAFICAMMLATAMASPTNQKAPDTCSLVMAEAGLNATAFMKAAAHGIHSITVEDLKYYFDPSVPNNNDIPTVNPNLRGPHVFLSAKFGSEFETPGMRMMDFILSNDDGNDNFMIRGVTRMEKIAHGMHMLELWQKTSRVYNKIRENPPKNKVCSCATDEARNGILQELRKISIYLRNFGKELEEPVINLIEEEGTAGNELDGDVIRVKRSPLRQSYYSQLLMAQPAVPPRRPSRCFSYTYEFWGCKIKVVVKTKRSAEDTITEEADEMPELKDAKSWKTWKMMLKESMLDDNGIYNLALYLYCKIAALNKY